MTDLEKALKHIIEVSIMPRVAYELGEEALGLVYYPWLKKFTMYFGSEDNNRLLNFDIPIDTNDFSNDKTPQRLSEALHRMTNVLLENVETKRASRGRRLK